MLSFWFLLSGARKNPLIVQNELKIRFNSLNLPILRWQAFYL